MNSPDSGQPQIDDVDEKILEGLRKENAIGEGQGIVDAEQILRERKDTRAHLLRVLVVAKERAKQSVAQPDLTGYVAGVEYKDPDSYLNAARTVLLAMHDYGHFILFDKTPVQEIPLSRLLRLKMCADFLRTRLTTHKSEAVRMKANALAEELKQRIGRCLNHMGAELDADCIGRLDVKALISSASLSQTSAQDFDGRVLIVIPKEMHGKLTRLNESLRDLGIAVDCSRHNMVRALTVEQVDASLKEYEQEKFDGMVNFALDLIDFIYKELKAELAEEQREYEVKHKTNREARDKRRKLIKSIKLKCLTGITGLTADEAEIKSKLMVDYEKGIIGNVMAEFGMSAEEAHKIWAEAFAKFIDPAL